MKTLMADFYNGFNAGKISFQPFAVINGKKVYPDFFKRENGNGNIHLAYSYKNGCTDDFFIDGTNCIRSFHNGKKLIHLNELGLTLNGITFGAKAADDYFYHNENPRIYERMTFNQTEAKWLGKLIAPLGELSQTTLAIIVLAIGVVIFKFFYIFVASR